VPSISAGSGADADAALAAAIAVALAVAEQAQKPPEHGQAAPVAGVSPWVLDGRRRLMDSHGRMPR
jgi:hypothetical protein